MKRAHGAALRVRFNTVSKLTRQLIRFNMLFIPCYLRCWLRWCPRATELYSRYLHLGDQRHVTSFYSQQFSLPYFMNILLVVFLGKKRREKGQNRGKIRKWKTKGKNFSVIVNNLWFLDRYFNHQNESFMIILSSAFNLNLNIFIELFWIILNTRFLEIRKI